MKSLRPETEKPLLLLEFWMAGNSACLRFRYEQNSKEIKSGILPDDYVYVFDASDPIDSIIAADITKSELRKIRLPQWIVIKSLEPFVFEVYNSTLDDFTRAS